MLYHNVKRQQFRVNNPEEIFDANKYAILQRPSGSVGYDNNTVHMGSEDSEEERDDRDDNNSDDNDQVDPEDEEERQENDDDNENEDDISNPNAGKYL